jgi:hypothetical protein
MASQKQLAANRLNARKSTGPRSVEGKARASMNALKTGIDARSQVIRGEDPEALEELVTDYHGRFQPITPEQRMLVDTLVDCEWLLRRFRAVETQLWEDATHIFDITLAQAYSKKCDEFTRLQRRIDMTQRQYHNALRQLERLQAEEAADPDPEPGATSCSQTSKPQNGFVPQNAVEEPSTPVDSPAAPPPASPNGKSKSGLGKLA